MCEIGEGYLKKGSMSQFKAEKEKRQAVRGHKLLPKAARCTLPPIYSQEEKGLEALARVKFFTPDSSWTWYASEFDGEDTFFGLVSGFEVELGYFSFSELEQIRGPLGLPIERDRSFRPTSLRELQEREIARRG